MENLRATARDKMRGFYDSASGHRAYATMLASAGMTRLAEKRLAIANAESAMANVWAAIYGELMA